MKRFFLTAVFTVILITTGAAVSAADFSWTVSDDIVKPEFWSDKDIDAEPGTYYDGKDFYLVCSEGNAASATRINKWKRFKGTSMDDLVELEDSVLIGFDRPHGDDRYWLSGLYVDEDTGIWYTTVHDEFNYYASDTSAHERYILYATSEDKGATWTLRDIIISSSAPENYYDANSGRYVPFGVGDQKIYVDSENGYIYCYYMEAWTDKENQYMFKTYNAARSPIDAKFAAGSWTKWYKGEWCEPGLGGYESPLFSPPSTGVYVAYNSYIDRYMAIGMQKESNEAFISTCTDLEKNDWSLPEKFYSNKLMGWYSWCFDNETRSRHTIGKSFRFYTCSHTYDQLQYREVTLDNTVPSDAEYYYPDYSYLKGTTIDYNDMMDFTPEYAYRENFSKGFEGWELKSGSADLRIEKQQKSLLITNTGDEAAVLIDGSAPSLSEGQLDFTVALQGGERFGILIGYADNEHYVRLGYDTGVFTWELPNGKSAELFEARLLNGTGQPYYFNIEFKYGKLKISIDENVVFDGAVPENDGVSGKYGVVIPEGEAVMFDDFAYYNGIKVIIDGVPIGFDVKPQTSNGRIVVPMRKIFELFGADVTYDEESSKIVAVKGDKEIILTAGSNQAMINGAPVDIDVGVVVSNGRALVPVRFISEQFGADVVWDSENRRVEITSNGNLAVGLQQLEPYPLKLKEVAAIGIVDYLEDYTTTHTNVGSFMYKADVAEEYDIRGRIYRTYEAEPAARIYHIEEADISEIVLKIATQTEVVEDFIKCYVSPDGEEWTELAMQSANSVKDTSRANMYYADYYPKKCVAEGMRYFKVELLANGKNWSSQLGRVDINRSRLEAQSDLLAEGQIYDRFRDLTNIYSLDGEVYTESDNRSEFNSVYRLYRKTPTLSSALTYLNTEDITNAAITVYTKGTDTQKYFDVYMSQDGKIWDKAEMQAAQSVEDPANAGMYFTELNCEAVSAANVYLKIVIKGGFETWANQLVNVRINVKSE